MRQLLAVLVLFAVVLPAQKGTGELRISVVDGTGTAVEAQVELTGQSTGVRLSGVTNGGGRWTAKPLPFGPYALRVTRPGFETQLVRLEIRSEVPIERKIALGVAPVETTLVVHEAETLLDPHRTATVYFAGKDQLAEHHAAHRSRNVLEMVNSQPGWLLEANGVLHPRGSEYNTQYVIDGIPVTDNRSPTFAPGLELEDLESMNVLTAGYPAEYGRKLGGVVEVVSARDHESGLHGKASVEGGSFGSQAGYFGVRQKWSKTVLSLAGHGGATRRFLDPPVEENFTNRATGAGYSARFEQDFTDRDRLSVYLHGKRAGFLVPNELEQQEHGQRQDRRNVETMGQISYQRVLSPELVAQVRGMARDLTSDLWSNELATPIFASHQRGFRDGYAGASLAWSRGRHAAKAGFEGAFSDLFERFGYRITDKHFFDDEIPQQFSFAESGKGREVALFVQDQVRAGPLTLSLGVRWDRYSLVVKENALSPRLGIAYHVPKAGLRLHASYDRAFEIPAIEGLLLASSPLTQRLTDESTGLPLQPSRSHFSQVGFAKTLWGRMRLDGNYFWRRTRNFADDSLLLNTGISFPVSFDRASIHGFEAKLELPRWSRFGGWISYSNMSGKGFLPLTGGLFLEEDTAELLESHASFPLTQDQRNTMRARMRIQLHPRAWIAWGASYNSGLPFEREGKIEPEELEERFSRRILDKVDFMRGRVKPQFSLDASVGVALYQREHQRMLVQADFWNLTNRLNVVNFSGLFSGTALAPARNGSVRLTWEF